MSNQSKAHWFWAIFTVIWQIGYFTYEWPTPPDKWLVLLTIFVVGRQIRLAVTVP